MQSYVLVDSVVTVSRNMVALVPSRLISIVKVGSEMLSIEWHTVKSLYVCKDRV